MSSKVKRIVLNSEVLGNLLKTDDTIKEIINDAAEEVEKEMPKAVSENNSLASSKNGRKSFGQEVFKKEAEPTDRQKVIVGIHNAQNSDFIYGTINKAVEKAGGKRGKR